MSSRKQNLKPLFVALSVSAITTIIWVSIPDISQLSNQARRPLALSESELLAHARSLQSQTLPQFTRQEREAAALGRKFFYDSRFSADGKISCASCHQPENYFSDGKEFAFGTGAPPRHTPSLANVFGETWFFWDGRADSLISQVHGPIEATGEHGIDRGRVVQLVWKNHQKDFESLFGPLPEPLLQWLASVPNFSARPEAQKLELPLSVAHYGLATIDSMRIQSRWIQDAANRGIAPQKFLAKTIISSGPSESDATKLYGQLDVETRTALEKAFTNFSWAIAQYERGLIALDSPFDRFVERTKRLTNSEVPLPQSFDAEFGSMQWQGFKIFTESGCGFCHSGPLFTDQQFHNIGLPQRDYALDLGRAVGIVKAKADPMNCKGLAIKVTPPSESCLELDYLRDDNSETVGAFKTPSLRNVAKTPPYMHDGRFSSLRQVLGHYNALSTPPAVGHREEVLRPLHLSDEEFAQLEAFLQSLTAPMHDLTAGH